MKYLHTMIRVKDIDESLKFYCNGLGLKETRRIENEKGRFTLVFLAAQNDEKAEWRFIDYEILHHPLCPKDIKYVYVDIFFDKIYLYY